jgi:hypothetical protein
VAKGEKNFPRLNYRAPGLSRTNKLLSIDGTTTTAKPPN